MSWTKKESNRRGLCLFFVALFFLKKEQMFLRKIGGDYDEKIKAANCKNGRQIKIKR